MRSELKLFTPIGISRLRELAKRRVSSRNGIGTSNNSPSAFRRSCCARFARPDATIHPPVYSPPVSRATSRGSRANSRASSGESLRSVSTNSGWAFDAESLAARSISEAHHICRSSSSQFPHASSAGMRNPGGTTEGSAPVSSKRCFVLCRILMRFAVCHAYISSASIPPATFKGSPSSDSANFAAVSAIGFATAKPALNAPAAATRSLTPPPHTSPRCSPRPGTARQGPWSRRPGASGAPASSAPARRSRRSGARARCRRRRRWSCSR